jgi:uncharacterized protein involved in cysteine biosynthesis
MYGAAAATLAAQAVIFIGLIGRLWRRFGLFPLAGSIKLIGAAAAAFLAARMASVLMPGMPRWIDFLVEAALGCMLYVALALVFRLVEPAKLGRIMGHALSRGTKRNEDGNPT